MKHKSRLVALVCYGMIPIAFFFAGVTGAGWYFTGFLFGAIGTSINSMRYAIAKEEK